MVNGSRITQISYTQEKYLARILKEQDKYSAPTTKIKAKSNLGQPFLGNCVSDNWGFTFYAIESGFLMFIWLEKDIDLRSPADLTDKYSIG